MRGEDSGAHLGLFDVRAVCVSILDGAYDWIFQRYEYDSLSDVEYFSTSFINRSFNGLEIGVITDMS